MPPARTAWRRRRAPPAARRTDTARSGAAPPRRAAPSQPAASAKSACATANMSITSAMPCADMSESFTRCRCSTHHVARPTNATYAVRPASAPTSDSLVADTARAAARAPPRRRAGRGSDSAGATPPMCCARRARSARRSRENSRRVGPWAAADSGVSPAGAWRELLPRRRRRGTAPLRRAKGR